jgi:hypothetical protein
MKSIDMPTLEIYHSLIKTRGKFSMDEIRATHGSEKISEKERNKLRAA